ncbi:unnamed protein product [Symbiodinium necroappetens]|uniref:Methyltransferase FkbM domain-containing protein n=1 Tax=Symbiodinium necroappetens TaxID=1628268 RepID=A0A812PAV8_9DINO|nr:unnamed protein product [Symbiodinium necroappetens]
MRAWCNGSCCLEWGCLLSGLVAASGSFRACPPPDAQCVARVRSELAAAWKLRAEVDKSISQRSYELLVLYDWIPEEEAGQRRTALRGVEAMEAGRQLLCASTFIGCDSEGVDHAVSMIEPQRMSIGSLAEVTIAKCGRVPPDLNMDWFGVCSNAILEWTEAEYMLSAERFMTHSGQPQLADDADKFNLRKTDSAARYGAVIYPPVFSPGKICELSRTTLPSKDSRFGAQSVFSGEAFHDVSWVDVTNLRTRHLSSISLLEMLENGADFQTRHPFGLSRVAVNLGGGDGACRVGHGLDPVNCFFPQGFGGVVFEANKSLEQALKDNLAQFGPSVQIVLEEAAEETVSEVLEDSLSKRPAQVARDEVDIIKVDVDGPDCHLVRGLSRAGWKPKIWHVEINPLFPPGIAVWPQGPILGSSTTVNRQGDLSSAFSRRGAMHEKQALVGCSLQALLDSVGPEYIFVHMEFENAVLVRQDLSTALEPWLSSRDTVQKWRDGYFCHPMARVRMPHDSDPDSLFLHYDFRRWGDPTLSTEQLARLAQDFLDAFVQGGTYSFNPASPSFRTGAGPDSRRQRAHVVPYIEDSNCESTSKSYVFQWRLILENLERLLSAWAAGNGHVEGVLTTLVENFASQLNIDRAWPIFKSVAAAECPLGGIAIATAMRWRCQTDFWKDNPICPATADLFAAMGRQLPLVFRNRSGQHSDVDVSRSAFAAPLGCEPMLLRYIETSLRRLPLEMVLRSKWPVFELLSSMHSESERWPRGYP